MTAHKEERIRAILAAAAPIEFRDGTFFALPGDRAPAQTAGSGLLGRIQDRLKQHGRLYSTLRTLFKPVLVNPKCKRRFREILNRCGPDHTVLNLGSGPSVRANRSDVINLDLFAFREVDVVADAAHLPFDDAVADLVLNMAMLEHVRDPVPVLTEMRRILKPGGQVVCYVPFLVPYHAAPADYRRWTAAGAETLFGAFTDVHVMVGGGPASALLWIFQEWLAIALSCGSRRLHDLLLIAAMALTWPFKWLDLLLVHAPSAANMTSGFYVFARAGDSGFAAHPEPEPATCLENR